MAQDDILSTSALYHLGRNLTSESTLLLVSAILSTQSDDVLIEELCDRSEVDEWCADDHTTVGLLSLQSLIQLLCQSDTILEIHVHLPVTCNNFLSHFYFFFVDITN